MKRVDSKKILFLLPEPLESYKNKVTFSQHYKYKNQYIFKLTQEVYEKNTYYGFPGLIYFLYQVSGRHILFPEEIIIKSLTDQAEDVLNIINEQANELSVWPFRNLGNRENFIVIPERKIIDLILNYFDFYNKTYPNFKYFNRKHFVNYFICLNSYIDQSIQSTDMYCFLYTAKEVLIESMTNHEWKSNKKSLLVYEMYDKMKKGFEEKLLDSLNNLVSFFRYNKNLNKWIFLNTYFDHILKNSEDISELTDNFLIVNNEFSNQSIFNVFLKNTCFHDYFGIVNKALNDYVPGQNILKLNLYTLEKKGVKRLITKMLLELMEVDLIGLNMFNWSAFSKYYGDPLKFLIRSNIKTHYHDYVSEITIDNNEYMFEWTPFCNYKKIPDVLPYKSIKISNFPIKKINPYYRIDITKTKNKKAFERWELANRIDDKTLYYLSEILWEIIKKHYPGKRTMPEILYCNDLEKIGRIYQDMFNAGIIPGKNKLGYIQGLFFKSCMNSIKAMENNHLDLFYFIVIASNLINNMVIAEDGHKRNYLTYPDKVKPSMYFIDVTHTQSIRQGNMLLSLKGCATDKKRKFQGYKINYRSKDVITSIYNALFNQIWFLWLHEKLKDVKIKIKNTAYLIIQDKIEQVINNLQIALLTKYYKDTSIIRKLSKEQGQEIYNNVSKYVFHDGRIDNQILIEFYKLWNGFIIKEKSLFKNKNIKYDNSNREEIIREFEYRLKSE